MVEGMQTRIQIYVDENGEKSSILMPYDEWTRLNNKVKRLEAKLKVFSGIRDGMSEVREAAAGGKKLQSLSDFVNESRN